MLLFVPTSSFEGFDEHPYDPTSLSQLLACLIVIVSFVALTLTLCHAILMMLVGTPIPGFGPPPSHHVMLSI